MHQFHSHKLPGTCHTPPDPIRAFKKCPDLKPECIPPQIECEEQCEQYTHQFTAPIAISAFYNPKPYIHIECGQRKPIPYEDLRYEVYQIFEDNNEEFIGYWDIQNKETPNLKKFEFCGNYELRYCSMPCGPLCLHPPAPLFIESDINTVTVKESCCDGSYIASAAGEANPQFETFNEFLIRIPPCSKLQVIVNFESHQDSFTLMGEDGVFTFDSGKFCEMIISIQLVGTPETIEKTYIIVKR